jgi:hypothetical protein
MILCDRETEALLDDGTILIEQSDGKTSRAGEASAMPRSPHFAHCRDRVIEELRKVIHDEE